MFFPRLFASTTPFGAVARGLLAGAAGTAAMDAVWFIRYRKGGGEDSLQDWEFSAGLDDWAAAPAPAHVGKRVAEALLQKELPSSAARLTNNVTHWGYGLFWGSVYGMVAASISQGTVRSPRGMLTAGVAFGSVVWGSGYVVLPLLKLYRPIWEYDARTLAKDLTAHLAYGVGTAVTFGLSTRRNRDCW